MPAKSLHSYVDTLYAILDEFHPEKVFEWGPGVSTQIIALFPSVKTLVSVEHDVYFYDLVERLKIDNVVFHYKPNMDEYVNQIGEERYDLIFVDGRDRSRCLECASKLTEVVILHDAARIDYRDSVDTFKYQVWTDEGNTAVLTNSKDVYERVKSCLLELECNKPVPEVIIFKKEAKDKGWNV